MPETKVAEDKPRRDKSDLVNDAMRQLRMPSFEAWSLTVDELTAKLKEALRG